MSNTPGVFTPPKNLCGLKNKASLKHKLISSFFISKLSSELTYVSKPKSLRYSSDNFLFISILI